MPVPKKEEKDDYTGYCLMLGVLLVAILAGLTVVGRPKVENALKEDVYVRARSDGGHGIVEVIEDNVHEIRWLLHSKTIIGARYQDAAIAQHAPFAGFAVQAAVIFLKVEGKPETKQMQHALIIGLGAGSVVGSLNRNKFITDVIEMDKAVVALSGKYFASKPTGSTVIADALAWVDRNSKEIDRGDEVKHYDVIVHDIFTGKHSSSLYTIQHIQKVRKLLKPFGVLVLNIVAFHNCQTDTCFASSVLATLEEAFSQARCYRDQDPLSDSLKASNIICFASDSSFTFEYPESLKQSTPHSSPWVMLHFQEWDVTDELKKYDGEVISGDNVYQFDDEFTTILDDLKSQTRELLPEKFWN